MDAVIGTHMSYSVEDLLSGGTGYKKHGRAAQINPAPYFNQPDLYRVAYDMDRKGFDVYKGDYPQKVDIDSILGKDDWKHRKLARRIDTMVPDLERLYITTADGVIQLFSDVTIVEQPSLAHRGNFRVVRVRLNSQLPFRSASSDRVGYIVDLFDTDHHNGQGQWLRAFYTPEDYQQTIQPRIEEAANFWGPTLFNAGYSALSSGALVNLYSRNIATSVTAGAVVAAAVACNKLREVYSAANNFHGALDLIGAGREPWARSSCELYPSQSQSNCTSSPDNVNPDNHSLNPDNHRWIPSDADEQDHTLLLLRLFMWARGLDGIVGDDGVFYNEDVRRDGPEHRDNGPDLEWHFCANENSICDLPDSAAIRYGADGEYIWLGNLATSIACTNAKFGGDPAPNVPKTCEYQLEPWMTCANEGEKCNVPGISTVRYGADGTYNVARGVEKTIECNNETFGDPVPGIVKSCEYLAE